jgi:predicted O-methyltransferase YrrM
MLTDLDRREIARLWQRKLDQDERKLPQAERHRNLEPDSAELLSALVEGLRARAVVEIGGSSGLSTIALASAMRTTGGRLVSIEIEPERQAKSRRTLALLGLDAFVDYRLADAAIVVPTLPLLDFALIDCEKDDYVRFFDLLPLKPGAIVVADNVLSHDLSAYQAHVRERPHLESITLAVGKGLEVTRVVGRGSR